MSAKTKVSTAEQQRIEETLRRFVEVLAYAGTGKTSTLVLRVLKLIERGARPSEILVLTFSNKAVAVLTTKVPKGVRVQTMHAFALGLAAAPAGAKPTLLSEKAAKALLKPILRRRFKALSVQRREVLIDRLGTKPDFKLILQFLDLMAATGMGAAAVAKQHRSRFGAIQYYATFFDRLAASFARAVKKIGAIRYGDMIAAGTKSVATQNNLLFKHLLVDEWQDSSAAQGHFVKALAQHMQTVMVLGDRLQAIYGFAGAKPMRLRSLLAGAHSYPLTKSFRLNRRAAAFATAFVRLKRPKALRVVGTEKVGRRPVLLLCPKAARQVPWVAEQVRRLLKKGAKPESIAILAGMKQQLREVEQRLVSAGIPVTAAHVNSESRRVLQALRFMGKVEKLEGGPDLSARLLKLLQKADQRNSSDKLLGEYRRKLERTLESASRSAKYRDCMKVYVGLSPLGVKDAPLKAELNRWQAKSAAFQTAKALHAHVREVLAATKVQTLTIHAAKGGEWDHVIVLNVVDGVMPHFGSRHGTTSMDEQRSVFYVAATRHRKNLVMIEAPFKHKQVPKFIRSEFITDLLACAPKVVRVTKA